MSTENPVINPSFDGGMLLGMGLRYLAASGLDDADIMAACSGLLAVIRDPSIAGPGAVKWAEAAQEMGDELQSRMIREDPNDQ